MTRDMFLQELRIALQGHISQVQVNEQLQYYENYIIEESRKGRSQEEVIASLGSPRLIAKTIIQMSGDMLRQDGFTTEGTRTNPNEEAGAKKGFSIRFGRKNGEDTGGRRFGLRPWYKRLLSGIFVLVLLAMLIKLGLFLLPLLAAVFMTGAILYAINLIFFGNKK